MMPLHSTWHSLLGSGDWFAMHSSRERGAKRFWRPFTSLESHHSSSSALCRVSQAGCSSFHSLAMPLFEKHTPLPRSSSTQARHLLPVYDAPLCCICASAWSVFPGWVSHAPFFCFCARRPCMAWRSTSLRPRPPNQAIPRARPCPAAGAVTGFRCVAAATSSHARGREHRTQDVVFLLFVLVPPKTPARAAGLVSNNTRTPRPRLTRTSFPSLSPQHHLSHSLSTWLTLSSSNSPSSAPGWTSTRS